MFSDPQTIVSQFNLKEGMYIADFGAGSGAYSFACAPRVTPGGKVYAVEVQKELTVKIKNEAVRLHFLDIEVVWGDIEHVGGTKLRDHSVEGVILSNVFFQVEDKTNCIKEIKRILKPEGKVFLIDWSDSFGGMGPAQDVVISETKAREFFEKAGFVFEKSLSVGAHHYGMVLRK